MTSKKSNDERRSVKVKRLAILCQPSPLGGRASPRGPQWGLDEGKGSLLASTGRYWGFLEGIPESMSSLRRQWGSKEIEDSTQVNLCFLVFPFPASAGFPDVLRRVGVGCPFGA